MWEFLTRPAEIFIEGGINAFRQSKEMQNVMLAAQDRIRRESRFNEAVLDELLKDKNRRRYSGQKCAGLILSLKTRAFEDVDGGALPPGLPFPIELDQTAGPDWLQCGDRHMKRIEKITDLRGLLECTYHRIMLAKTFAGFGKRQGDFRDIKFLINRLACAMPPQNPA